MDHEAERLLERESDLDYVKTLLRRQLSEQGRARTELTFNVTDVLLNFEGGTATIGDVLDPDVSVTVPLDDLRRYSE